MKQDLVDDKVDDLCTQTPPPQILQNIQRYVCRVVGEGGGRFPTQGEHSSAVPSPFI